MAILTCLPGLEVAVEVDGQRAHEYDVDPEEVESRAEEIDFHRIQQTHRRRRHGDPCVLKYIEAKPGKPFAFIFDMTNCRDFSTGPSIHYTCVMDGFTTATKRVYNGTLDRRSCCETGNKVTGWKLHHFRFGSLDILEGAGGTSTQVDKAKQYGTLIVMIYQLVATDRFKAPSDRAGPTPIHSVYEKDLKGKAVDSKVSFDSEPMAQPGHHRISNYVDPSRRPIAVFEFRYRTMEGLYQEAIVPRPVVKSEEVVDVEEEYKRIKHEPEDDAPRGVKREAPMDDALFAARYKQRRLEDGKIEIDLTDD